MMRRSVLQASCPARLPATTNKPGDEGCGQIVWCTVHLWPGVLQVLPVLALPTKTWEQRSLYIIWWRAASVVRLNLLVAVVQAVCVGPHNPVCHFHMKFFNGYKIFQVYHVSFTLVVYYHVVALNKGSLNIV